VEPNDTQTEVVSGAAKDVFDVEAHEADDDVTALEDDVVADGTKQRRQRSTIAFPYNDLQDAIAVAHAIHQNGGDWATDDQLAAWLGHEGIRSGAFRLKVSTARTFGLISVGREQITLTDLGNQIIDPQRNPRQARVSAFLSVPLYRSLYDSHRGRMLPPDPALEQVMVNLGVSVKQKDKARQAFQRSAKQAGFFDQGSTRLVLPSGISDSPISMPGRGDADPVDEVIPPRVEPPTPRSDQVSGGGTSGDIPPVKRGTGNFLIDGLFEALPTPGQPWSGPERKAWITLAEAMFDVVYGKLPDTRS